MQIEIGIRAEPLYPTSAEFVQPDTLLTADNGLKDELLAIGRPAWSLHRLEILRELPRISAAAGYDPDITPQIDREPTVFGRVHGKTRAVRDGYLCASLGCEQQAKDEKN